MNRQASPIPPEDDPYMRLLQIILDQQNSILEKVEQISDVQEAQKKELHDHMVREERMFASALPAGDAESHRRAHESWMEEQQEAKAIKRAVRERVVSGIVWGAVVAIGAALWAYLQSQLK
jgi:hypothetical protein